MQQPSTYRLATSVAVSLILISAAISAALRLGLGQRLLLAAVRTTVQLLLDRLRAAMALRPGRAWYFVLAMMSAMTLIAGISAVRAERTPLRGHLGRQHHLHVGHELADDGHRPVRHRAGPRGGGSIRRGTIRATRYRCWA